MGVDLKWVGREGQKLEDIVMAAAEQVFVFCGEHNNFEDKLTQFTPISLSFFFFNLQVSGLPSL